VLKSHVQSARLNSTSFENVQNFATGKKTERFSVLSVELSRVELSDLALSSIS